MTLPLGSAGIGGRCVVGRLVVLAGVLAGVLLPLAAARADAGDPYSATVKVDATADNVADAREKARLGGERRALAQVVASLSGGVGDPRLAKLGDPAISDLVSSFGVANERMSSVRYLADYTFHFNPAGVRRLLQSDGVAIAAPGDGGTGDGGAVAAPADNGAGGPIVVLPVYDTAGGDVLWGDPNPWRAAWAAQSASLAAPGSARLVVPLGDPGDTAAIDAQKARAGDSAALAAIARKDGADTVVVAQARMRPGNDPDGPPTGLDIFLQRYRGGRLVDSESNSLAAAPGESVDSLLSRAVAASAGALAGGSAASATLPGAPGGPQASVTVAVPITSLADWVRLRNALTAMPAIRKVALMSLTLTTAEIAIRYTGSIDQLTASLAASNLTLVPGNPVGQLQRGGMTSAR